MAWSRPRETTWPNTSRNVGEEALVSITEKNPKPSHSFLSVESLDDIKEGLPSRVGGNTASAIIARDTTLARCQEKATRIMGPLGKLWRMLDRARKANKEGATVELDTAKALRLAEQTVVLCGQTTVATHYTRKLGVPPLGGRLHEGGKTDPSNT